MKAIHILLLSLCVISTIFTMQNDTTGDNRPIIITPALSRWQRCKNFVKNNKTRIAIGTTLTIATAAGLACDLGSAITAPQEVNMAIALPAIEPIPPDTEYCTFQELQSCFHPLIENRKQCEAYVEQNGSFILQRCSMGPEGEWQYFGIGSVLTRYIMVGASFAVEWVRRYP